MCVDMTTCICAHVCMIYSYNYIYSKLFIQFYQYIRKYNDNKNNKNNNNNNNSNVYICACISEYTVYIYTYYRNSMKQWHLATSWPGRGRNPCGSERAKTRRSEGSGPWRDPVDGKSKRVQTENQLKTLQRKFKTCNCISIDV